MHVRHLLPPLLAVAVLLWGALAGVGRAADDERPPMDREEHETVKTATFALG